MRKRLTPEEKKQYVVKQTLTAKEVERLENNPNARRISHSEIESLLETSLIKVPV